MKISFKLGLFWLKLYQRFTGTTMHDSDKYNIASFQQKPGLVLSIFFYYNFFIEPPILCALMYSSYTCNKCRARIIFSLCEIFLHCISGKITNFCTWAVVDEQKMTAYAWVTGKRGGGGFDRNISCPPRTRALYSRNKISVSVKFWSSYCAHVNAQESRCMYTIENVNFLLHVRISYKKTLYKATKTLAQEGKFVRTYTCVLRCTVCTSSGH